MLVRELTGDNHLIAMADPETISFSARGRTQSELERQRALFPPMAKRKCISGAQNLASIKCVIDMLREHAAWLISTLIALACGRNNEITIFDGNKKFH